MAPVWAVPSPALLPQAHAQPGGLLPGLELRRRRPGELRPAGDDNFVPCAQRWGAEGRKLGKRVWRNTTRFDYLRFSLGMRSVGNCSAGAGTERTGATRGSGGLHRTPVAAARVTCRASVLPIAQLDLPDLGLVEAGTQCGPRMVSPAHPTPAAAT